MKTQNILFFADRLPPFVGGVEVHADYFIKHFSRHLQFPISEIITKTNSPIKNSSDFFFFNSGRWIEELEELRNLFPNATFIYRTGGNEILKAPLVHQQISDYSSRVSYWIKTINNTIDLLITNSAYTEARLHQVGITCPFLRCVGGVNTTALQSSDSVGSKVTIFCAARFVPYKNHALLVSVIRCLVSRGYDLQVRLAGDGPLLNLVQEQVVRENLSEVVHFLGEIENTEVCKEIAHAQIYMQLSTDHLTEVEGGCYIHSEGMGRSILEALTAGTFVIAGKSGALPEIVTENRGILVDLGSAEEIANIIDPILRQPPKRTPFLNDYSWENVFKKYEIFMGRKNAFASH